MPDPRARRGLKRRLGLAGIGASVGVAVLVVTGIGARDKSSASLQNWTEAQATPTVAILAPERRREKLHRIGAGNTFRLLGDEWHKAQLA